jgi:hypothetical protein
VERSLACLANATRRRRATGDLAATAEETSKWWFPAIESVLTWVYLTFAWGGVHASLWVRIFLVRMSGGRFGVERGLGSRSTRLPRLLIVLAGFPTMSCDAERRSPSLG